MKKLIIPFTLVILLSSCMSSRNIYNPTYARLETSQTVQLFDECMTTEHNTLDITPKYLFINDSVSLKILKVVRRNHNSYVYVLERPEMAPDCLEINKIGDRIVYYYACQEIKTVLTASVVSGSHTYNGI
ncbi:hypothetical protein [Ekhidna sp.]|uniref:hypothetical protein n=1 Tax=Ekhidna sp. TaxID=2608089 RepID=UPI003CCC3B0E